MKIRQQLVHANNAAFGLSIDLCVDLNQFCDDGSLIPAEIGSEEWAQGYKDYMLKMIEDCSYILRLLEELKEV